MRSRVLAAAVALVAIFVVASPATASAAPAAAWNITSIAVPTNFTPGGGGEPGYEVVAENIGGGFTDGSPIVLTDRLPAGLTVETVELKLRPGVDAGPSACATTESAGAQTVRCEITSTTAGASEPTRLRGGEALTMFVRVGVPAGASGALRNSVEVQGGGVLPAGSTQVNQASFAPAPAGIAVFDSKFVDEEGRPLAQAGAHPYQYTTTFAVNTEPGPPGNAPFVPAGGDVKDIEVSLPPGLIGDPTAVTRCKASEFAEEFVLSSPGAPDRFTNGCPAGSVVGFVRIIQEEGKNAGFYKPIYNLVPPAGMPAQLGFAILKAPFYIDTKVRTGSDYGITAYLPNLSEVKRVTAASVTIWGTPADPVHDPVRGGECLSENPLQVPLSAGNCPAGIQQAPFLRMPTSCGTATDTLFSVDRWPAPGAFDSVPAAGPGMAGCSALDFSPSVSVVPQVKVADSPTGLDFELRLPQNSSPGQLAEADLRDATVTFPEGMTVDPSSANGLATCTPAQVGLTSAVGATPVTFTSGPASCPDAAKIGSVEVDTPLLDHPISGGVYVAAQGQNPFGSLLSIYIVADDPQTGVVLKLPGRVALDPRTGRVVTSFGENPQLPFEALKVSLFGGPRAALRTPTTCGTYRTATALRPWSAPETGPDATPSDSFAIDSAPTGGACATSEGGLPSAPSLEVGSVQARAGAYSPFVLQLSRADGTQQFASLTASLPEGLLARLAGIPYCPDSALAAVSEAEGTAAAQVAGPSCPAASQVGRVTVGAGAGPDPFYLDTGRAYLAGPYKGAPLSLAIVTPALAGPFDLGSLVVRTALQVDPRTTAVTAVSDPLPTILHGIPLDLRDIRVDLDRSDFIVNPTDCEPKSVAATVTGTAGAVSHPSKPFGATDCAKLGFKPGLKLRLKGATKRTGHPALTAVVTYPKGGAYANIARAQVSLPHSEFLDQGNIGTVCTQAQLQSRSCPKKSIYGYAKAWSPLLAKPLQGPVYLGVGYGHKLPDLVADLDGQIRVLLNGRIDTTSRGGIRNTFEAVPDAPVSRFVLRLKGGGKQGLLENSEALCKKPQRASVRFIGQNGRVEQLSPRIADSCGGRHKHKPKPRSQDR